MLTVACGVPEVNISADELAGSWSNPAGTSVELKRDGTFAASGLDKTEAAALYAEPGKGQRGTWEFAVLSEDADRPGHAAKADHGWVADVTLDDIACELQFNVYGDPESPIVCFTQDTFSECTAEEGFRRDRG
ncbi:hypothetical protein J7E96_11345 [Streptomyces sp. ISL-96]|uniref:hypothetical protein n=1 Tax=Streptomyces sp. ISL-96 TaxID=2819191 RepID=UPI001BE7A393|nr:hypothetical protein [Streptomyces sp. ISL-96]MBT2489106.1 hypothetical protein [Streptomyces sp. ISL-96]